MNSRAPGGRGPDAMSSGPRGVLEGLRILIVDDDGDARELLKTIFSQRRAVVFAAESVAEAMDLLERERPDVLVSDIAMPEEDGYTLIRRLRALAPERGGRTPAIALTAYAGSADRARALAAGFDRYFSKPLDLDALLDALIDVRSAAAIGAGG
ncbi:MAG: response regulator [Labilithrix sp.]|nr:response regulator [Labilithrix sp.]